jgi:pimeloyl-ACP methyl ester carboxylesterase
MRAVAKLCVGALLAVATITALPANAGANAEAGLVWTPCRSTIHGWYPDDEKSECTTVQVPEDYANPDGPRISLAVSRIRASSPADRRGVLLINPGGPGNSGLDMPYQLSHTKVAGIGADYDLVGFDPRGVAFSDGQECDDSPADGPDPDPKASAAIQFRQGYARSARENARCTGYDPEFIANLSTDVVARDMDSIRIALGEQKISFYGMSWGTALGAVYRSRYDAHVDRMLLDSVMPPDFSLRAMNDGEVAAGQQEFDRFAAWVAARDSRYHLGTAAQDVMDVVTGLYRELTAKPRTFPPNVTFTQGNLALIITYAQSRWPEMAASVEALRDGRTPPLLGTEADDTGGFGLTPTTSAGILMERSVLCNDQGADPDVATLWRQQQQRVARYPLMAGQAGYQYWCAGWPLSAQPWRLARGSSDLLLVGHRYETVTPYPWARQMQQRIGGRLFTVDDDVHASLDIGAQAAVAVRFFDS